MMMHLLKRASLTLALGMTALVVGGTSARADMLLNPAQTVTFAPEAGGFLSGATVEGTDLSNFDLGGNPNLAGNLLNVVVRETTGLLTFLFQLRNDGPGAIDSVSVSDYTGFDTRVGSLTGVPAPLTNLFLTPTASPAFPSNATRGVGGSTIIFDGGPILSGATSQIFFVRTNAATFNQLGAALATGATTGAGSELFASKFQPTGAAIPEPASMAMLAMGGLGMLGAARRRNRKA